MVRSSTLNIIAAALVAVALAGTTAHAQKGRSGRGLSPPPGTGRLRNAAQGMCLDVAGWAAQGDANVLLGECNGDPDHVWSFTRDGELRNTLNGTCLDAAGNDGQPGANVDVFRCESMDDQRWKLIPRGHGTFELHNMKRGLCLDATGRAGARGDNVLLWACDGGADQLWTFEPYAVPPRPVQDPPRLPTGPMPAPQHHGMDDGAFGALVTSVRKESFSEDQLEVVEQAATHGHFRVAQLRTLIDTVSFSATKLRVLELCAPHIVDSENVFTLFDAFTFSADKEQAHQILRRNGF
jgi:hypothetical protein